MKKWKKLLSVAMAACLSVAVFAGCGGKEASKDTLRVGVTNFADSLEPTENAFGWVVMRYGMGETLTKFDEKMNIQPWLAEKWTISDDKLTWTFKIRDGVKFSNGNPLTAEAVKASIERAFAKNTRAATFFKYTEMKAEGQNLIITTDKPAPSMPGYLADPLFLIVDVSAEKDRDFAKQGPICTGPYVCESFVKEKAVMKKNPNYWDGEVPFETVEIPSIDDPNTRAMALQSGEVDMAVNIAPGDVGLFNDTSKYHVDKIASLRTVLARINEKGILGDPKVRAAFISMCDRKSYNEVILKGTFIEGKAPVPPSLDYGFDQLSDPNHYDIERAKKLLDEAGWKDTDGDGIRDKDGKPLSVDFIIYNSRAELPIYAEAVQADGKKIGFDIKVKTVDYNLLDKIGINGEYDLLISNIITANTGDPEIYLNWYWRTNKDGDNQQNGSGYSNPEYDAKCAALAVEFDPAKRRQLMIEMQQILLNDAAALFLGYPETNIISSTKITGATMYPSDYYWITNKIRPAK
ncbi:ABC transporter substrate-binding protein [Selenomonas sputigena]|uniref:ABC transporter, substrate-binding protein, family 5 n=1 Tax=Selenomonas sputigena (strain ATCC 35185 / DSM 20758 / CCUG 44933 / VPI D19B-28) TaxID=546271 RepID=C9LUI6_SELS3|nr:ABC transporter substrate-binding protein [Selenomonas sputigena]AEC00082.1 ABC-type transporter, periplasmic subunit [Selenomonas sputigena ATCC 35185]EEX77419.1 ABC transporter, substrate-binding protein, family 5 [Selenomonas sputigena ATCC 35185]UZD43794.1 ABC transporter substrate-binding protein [Selenomonas sputigena]